MDNFIEYRGFYVFYRTIGNSPDRANLLFLHGWGSNENGFAPIEPFFTEKYNCMFIRLPCFQKTDLNSPSEPYMLENYAAVVMQILDKEGIKKTSIIAHSFGARVSVLLVNEQPSRFDKLILTGAAGIPSRRSLFLRLKIRLYKIRRKLFKTNAENKGSSDYRALTAAGKVSFQNILKADLRSLIAKVQRPTLLIFGTLDRATPIYMAKLWTKLNTTTKLIIYRNAGHFCFIDEPIRFIIDVQAFLDQPTMGES